MERERGIERERDREIKEFCLPKTLNKTFRTLLVAHSNNKESRNCLENT